jgi:uncharacterized membrane protein YheB (UPF0754 family)
MGLWSFLIFPLVGAVIGALTNQLAIKMLFRPFEPIRFGGWQLPLTPGVVPRKRGQIAKSIATSFEQNLLSGNDIHEAVTGDEARAAVERKIDETLSALGPFAAMATPFKPKIVDKILEGVEDVASEAIKPGGSLHIGERIEAKINEMSLPELEKMILEVAHRELAYITLFGGILGALIGLAQAGLAVALA